MTTKQDDKLIARPESPYANVILQISDLHFGSDRTEGERLARQRALEDFDRTLDELEDAWRPTIICICGDIVDQGRGKHYADAKDWLKSLLARLRLDADRIVICPGNHDVLRACLPTKLPQTADDANRLLEIVKREEPIATEWRNAFVRFEEFCSECGIPSVSLGGFENHLVGCRVLRGIRFVCMNTAWFCGDANQPLYMGEPQLEYMVNSGQLPKLCDGREEVTVSVMHHPYECLAKEDWTAYDRLPAYKRLEEHSRLILCGDTHSATVKEKSCTKRCHRLVVGALYAHQSSRNRFHLIRVEPFKFTVQYWEGNQRSTLNYWELAYEHILNYGWDDIIIALSKQGITPSHYEFPPDAPPGPARPFLAFTDHGRPNIGSTSELTSVELGYIEQQPPSLDIEQHLASIERMLKVKEKARAAMLAEMLEQALSESMCPQSRQKLVDSIARAYQEHAFTLRGEERAKWLAKAKLVILKGAGNE